MINIPFNISKIAEKKKKTAIDKEKAEDITIKLHQFFNGDTHKMYRTIYFIQSDKYNDEYEDIEVPYTIEERLREGLQKRVFMNDSTDGEFELAALTFRELLNALNEITGEDNTNLVLSMHKYYYGDKHLGDDKIRYHRNTGIEGKFEYSDNDRLNDKTILRRAKTSLKTEVYNLTYKDFMNFSTNYFSEN